MGLIKSGIKYGGLFMIAKQGMKTYENSHANKQQQNQPQQPQYYQQQPPQQLPQDAQGTFHQHWCNRQCGGRCVSAETLRSIGAEADPAPRYAEKAPQYDAKAPVY